MIHTYALVTLGKAIVLPGLSRRTGKPCRVVSTRQLVVSIHHEEVALEGCLDPRGHGFRAALRNISTVQRGLIEHAEFMSPRSHVMRRVLDLPTAVDFRIGSPSAVYYSLSTGDSVELIGGWGDAQGNVTVQMLPICGFLVPAEDPVVAPWRQLGHLWPNGQFARPSGAEVVSFVKQGWRRLRRHNALKHRRRDRRALFASMGRRLATGRDFGRSPGHGGEDRADQQASKIRLGHSGTPPPSSKEATAAQHGRALGITRQRPATLAAKSGATVSRGRGWQCRRMIGPSRSSSPTVRSSRISSS